MDRRMRMFPSPGLTLSAIQATGTRIKTREYGELMDLESGCWAAVLGHSPPEILESMQSAQYLFHTHQFFNTEHPSALTAEITQAANLKGAYKGTFLSSGSEAVLLAVTLAGLLSGRAKKLSLAISYHGSLGELRMPRNKEQWLDLDISQCLACLKSSSCRDCDKYSKIDFSIPYR